jgi:hypothetical protein
VRSKELGGAEYGGICDICGRTVGKIIETWALNMADEVDCCEKCNDKLEEKRSIRNE